MKHSGPSFFFVEGSPACIHRLPFAGFELCLVVPASFDSNMTPSMTSTLKEAKRQRWLDHYLAEKLTESQRIMLQGSKPDPWDPTLHSKKTGRQLPWLSVCCAGHLHTCPAKCRKKTLAKTPMIRRIRCFCCSPRVCCSALRNDMCIISVVVPGT